MNYLENIYIKKWGANEVADAVNMADSFASGFVNDGNFPIVHAISAGFDADGSAQAYPVTLHDQYTAINYWYGLDTNSNVRMWNGVELYPAFSINSYNPTASDDIKAPLVNAVMLGKDPTYGYLVPGMTLDLGTFGSSLWTEPHVNGAAISDVNPMPIKAGSFDFAVSYLGVDTEKLQIFSTYRKSFSLMLSSNATTGLTFSIKIWVSPDGGSSYEEYEEFTVDNLHNLPYTIPEFCFDYLAITCEALDLGDGDFVRAKIMSANI